MVTEAEKEFKVLQQQFDQLSEWMLHNVNHPDFMKKVSERNHISVRMEVKRQQKSGNWDVPFSKVELIYSEKPTHWKF